MISYLPQTPNKTKTFEIPIRLTPCQRIIDSNSARFKIIRAGRKFGKSTYGIYSAIRKAGTPQSTIWFCAPTYRQGKLIAWKEFKKLLPKEVMSRKPNETDLVLTLKNGSEIYVMGADNPDSLRGPAPNHVVMEEVAMQQSEAWHEVIRPNLTAKTGSADFITTPKGFNWFKDLEDNARKLVAAGSKDWSVFHYTIYDNPYINRQEIEDAKSECDNELVWRQEYMAEYEASVGRVFSQFSDERHCRPFRAPATRFETFRGIDFGMRDDTACLWGTIIGNKLHVYREHLQNDTPASMQAALILNKTTALEDVQLNSISHDAAKEDVDLKGLTVKWHFENAGIRPLYLSSRNKQASRHMIQTLLHEDRLIIDPNACPKLRKQMLAYEWNDTLMEKTLDGKDDAVDALHYLVELLQARLYLNRPKEDIETVEKVRAELLAMRTQPRKWKIQPREDVSNFDFSDNPAGYL